ncbi:MAG: TatD family hydrolase [Acidobacteriota bacterium]
MIDSHCHLAGAEFAGDLAAVVARARAAGLVRCLVILAADDEAEIARVRAVRDAWPDVRFAVGVHPHQAARYAADPELAARVVAARLDAVAGVCAVGEIGLDYHYDFAPRDVQQAVFRTQLRLASTRGLPVVLHVREAEDDTLRLLEEEGAGHGLRGVFHCFTGGPRTLSRVITLGFHVSIPGIVTFPKAEPVRESARLAPADRLLVETDSPYLAPVPHRGKRNEPAYVVQVVEAVAAVRGEAAASLGAALVENFDALFGRGAT